MYNNNKLNYTRLIFDTGSMSNFVTKSSCERLNLKITLVPAVVKFIGKIENHSFGITQFKIYPHVDSRCFYTLSARIIDTITNFFSNSEIGMMD